jgi:hypothetical protein
MTFKKRYSQPDGDSVPRDSRKANLKQARMRFWPGSTPTEQSERSKKDADVGRWLPYLAVAPALGLVALTVYAVSLNSASVFAVAFLVAFLVGALLGFLFGIPRLLAAEGAPAVAPTSDEVAAGESTALRSPYRSNTNLEQISDWLTKILVGVGLVELGKLSSGTRRLVDFLAPGLGGEKSSPGFGLALLLLYGVSGFLIVYLLTRVYLGRVFAQADELMRRIDEVEEEQRQQKRDIEALSTVTRCLDADPADPEIAVEKLNKAVKDASDLMRIQIFNLARQRRQNGTPEQKKRTPDIFRALIAADTNEIWHRNHGQLGYALHDIERDFVGAEAALSTAVARRDNWGHGGFKMYEFVRALSRIELDPKSNTADPSDPEVLQSIIADLRRAHEDLWTRDKIMTNDRVDPWMKRNQLTQDDLENPPSTGPSS